MLFKKYKLIPVIVSEWFTYGGNKKIVKYGIFDSRED